MYYVSNHQIVAAVVFLFAWSVLFYHLTVKATRYVWDIRIRRSIWAMEEAYRLLHPELDSKRFMARITWILFLVNKNRSKTLNGKK